MYGLTARWALSICARWVVAGFWTYDRRGESLQKLRPIVAARTAAAACDEILATTRCSRSVSSRPTPRGRRRKRL